MATIVFCSTKGGVGKSTSALVLAQVLAEKGFKIKLVDTDPNQPIVDEWWQNAAPKFPPNIEVEGKVNENNIIDIIDAAASKYHFVIVDLEGSANLTASYAVSRADLVLIPMEGTKLDSREAAKVVSLISRESKARKVKIPYRIMFSKCSIIQTREEKAIRQELIEANLPVLSQGLMKKAIFSSIFGFGCTIYDLSNDEPEKANSAILNAEQVTISIIQALKDEGVI